MKTRKLNLVRSTHQLIVTLGLAIVLIDALVSTTAAQALDPRLLAEWTPSSGILRRIAVRNGLAYCGLENGWVSGTPDTRIDDSFVVVDVRDPMTPSQLGSIAVKGEIGEIIVSEGFAYVAQLGGAWDSASQSRIGGGIEVIDISNPTVPKCVFRFDLENVTGIRVVGGHLFACVDHAGPGEVLPTALMIFDISDPTAPSKISEYRREGSYINYIGISGHHAFITGGSDFGGEGLFTVLDIQDPSEPVFVLERYVEEMAANGITISGNLAVVASGGEAGYGKGISIFDISNPSLSPRVGIFRTIGGRVNVLNVTVVGDLALLAKGGNLEILDIGEPNNPVRVGGFALSYSTDIAVDGTLAYVAAGNLKILDLTTVLARPRLSWSEAGPTIRWEKGQLQFAPTLDGLWTDVPAVSPLLVSTLDVDQGFFRVKVDE